MTADAPAAQGAVVCESCRLASVTVLVFVAGEGFRTCTECAAAGIEPGGVDRVPVHTTASATGPAPVTTTGATTTRGLLW